MKRIMLLLSTILCIASVSGCAETPDEVKSDMSSYREETDSDPDSFEFTYISVADLSENAETALNKEYKQFKISDKIRFEQPDEINIMSFENISGFSEKAREALELFFTGQELSAQEPDEEHSGIMFYNETDKLYGCADDDGFIAVLKPDAFDISFSCQEPNVKIYHSDRKDDLSDEYQLREGKCSVGDAVQYVDNWFETNYKPLAPFYDYRVESVIVREHEGNYLYQMKVQAIYKGVALDSYTREVKFDDNYNHTSSYWDYSIQVQMIKSDEISSFANGGIYKPTEVERIDKCISMESALKFCENTFTDFKDVTISDIGIMYTIMPVYEKVSEGDDRVGDLNNEIVVRNDSRPVWEIVIDVPPEDYLAAGEVNIYGDIRKYIYIDMITGEMKYDLEVNKFKG